MNQNNPRFHPIQCTSYQLESLTPHDGEVYFVTDTHQLYLAKQGSMIEMCGGTNIFYGTKEIEYVNDGNEQNPEVFFTLEDIDGDKNLMVNDLILNTDGCFYKVIDISGDNFQTKRITLSGTGGYVPGGGTVVGGESYSLLTDLKNYVYSSTADEMIITFTPKYLGTEENSIVYVGFSFDKDLSSEGAILFYEIDTESYGFNTSHSIDLVKYRHLFTSSARTVYLNTEDAYGRKRSAKLSIKLVDLFLEAEYHSIIKINGSTGQYTCNIGGTTSGISNKKLTFNFYIPGDDIKPYYSYDLNIDTSTLGSYTCNIDTSELNHGSYTMTVTMSAQITGTQRFLSSNSLTHKIIKFDESVNTPVLTYIFPNKVETYVNNELSYYLATEDTRQYTLKIIINEVERQELLIESNTLKTYPLYFELDGVYNLTLMIAELGVKQSSLINVVKYTGEIPFIDPYESTLELYLTPQGQSNDSSNKNMWKDYKSESCAVLTDVNFSSSSGWLLDQDNISYLQLNSGGKLELNNYSPFVTDPTAVPENATKGKGLTIELDFEVNGITDYDANLIEWVSQNDNTMRNVGLIVKGNSVSFYSQQKNGIGTQGALTKIALVEGVRTRLSFVLDPKILSSNSDYEKYFPMCYTYLNGILSNAVIYDKTDSFVEHSSYPAHLKIDSTNASIKIYGIRVYKEAFNSRKILRNYIASLPSLEERFTVYKDNNVFDSSGNEVDFNVVSSEEYDLQIPYMVLTGGYATDAENNKWQLKEANLMGAAGLPTGKKDYRLVDVKVVYPDTDYFKQYGDYKNYEFINTFDNGQGMTSNFGNEPNNGGCIMYAQGTSSMEYPVKNLRLRFNKVKKEIDGEIVKSKENYFTVRPNISPVEIICMKADYMESSGSHNTGAANLIDDLYKKANLKTPGQEYFGPNGEGNKDNKEIVTCIKGHPCLIFYSPTGEPNTYQYVGKYNLNLDKATPEPFGFNHDDDFGWLSVGDPYYQIKYGEKDGEGYKDTFIGQEEPDDGADYVKNQEEMPAEVQPGENINSIHCFEFLDNAVSVCNFLNKPKTYIDDGNGNLIPDLTGDYWSYEETWYETFTNSEGKSVPGWTLGFESRYPEDRIGYHDADMLYEMASWLNELYYLKQTDIDQANARFKNEYGLYFNKDFLTFYYIVTEALLMADSRVKNMMIATWGRAEKSYQPLKQENGKWIVDTNAPLEETNYYEWYPIFYDMDTMLGLDNTGVDRFKYYDEDTDSSIYNGDEVLWNFVRDNLNYELNEMYGKLDTLLNTNRGEDGDWAAESVIPYFNKNQATMANEAFYNGDAIYKYIDPARNGYKDLLNGKDIKPGDAPYLYAAQGTRELARENFLVNRLKFLSGKRNGNQFLNGDQVEFRWNYPHGETVYSYIEIDTSNNFTYEPNKYYYIDANQEYKLDTSSTITEGRQYFERRETDPDRLSTSANDECVPPSTHFNFTALQPCYAGIRLGKNGGVTKEKFEANQTKDINMSEGSSANNTEAYLLGLSSLKSLGDLSNKYVQKFVMSGSNKLEELILGNPHKNYYNPYWSSDTSAARISLTGSTYLEKFNLQNCVTFRSALDFSPCPLINTILLTGSSVSAITLPRNGNLTELRLPDTIIKLVIDTHRNLSSDNFSIGGYKYIDDNGQEVDRIGQGKYENNYSRLQHIEIINTPIDTYNMIMGAEQLSSYCLEGVNWTLTNPESVGLPSDLSNKNANSISILEKLLDKQAKKGEKLLSNNSEHPGANGVTGTITIAVPNIEIDQYQIQQKYGALFPNLKIEFDDTAIGGGYKKAYKIEFFALAEASEPYYTVYAQQSDTTTETLYDLTRNLPIPTKSAELESVYTFANKWKVTYASSGGTINEGSEILVDTFVDIVPTQDLKLVAYFNRSTRFYSVNFYDHKGDVEATVDNYTYNMTISSNKKSIMYSYKPHTDDTNIEIQTHKRYSFKGWVSETDFYNWKNSRKIPTKFFDLYNTKVTYDNMRLYPYHVEENCKELEPNLNLFMFTNQVINGQEKYTIHIKPEYDLTLAGSIVIPATDSSGKPVEVIGHICPSNELITKIYFQPNGALTHIGGYSDTWADKTGVSAGLYSLEGLKYVYFPENGFTNLTTIGSSAFFLNKNLEVIKNLPDSITSIGDRAFQQNSKLLLNKLPQSLVSLGDSSFMWCSKIAFENVPLGVTVLPPHVFAYCESLKMSTFGHNNDTLTAEENNITTIKAQALTGSAIKVTNMPIVTLGKSIIDLEEKSFIDFGPLKFSLYLFTTITDKVAITTSNYTNYFGNADGKTITVVDCTT